MVAGHGMTRVHCLKFRKQHMRVPDHRRPAHVMYNACSLHRAGSVRCFAFGAQTPTFFPPLSGPGGAEGAGLASITGFLYVLERRLPGTSPCVVKHKIADFSHASVACLCRTRAAFA